MTTSIKVYLYSLEPCGGSTVVSTILSVFDFRMYKITLYYFVYCLIF